MAAGNVIVRFDEVTFGYSDLKLQLEEVSFSIREGTKSTIMGQNGAGKSTMFKLMAGELKPQNGKVLLTNNATIGMARQVIPLEQRDLTVRDFFASVFNTTIYDLNPRIAAVLEVVNLSAPLDRKVSQFSGGQQARLLLAQALIQEPDILLLDEPTNNLDQVGIDHLTTFLLMYDKTVIVISHDADFLNTFTDGVLYLDSHSKKVEQFEGNYFDVVEQITAQIERDQMKQARLKKDIQDRKDKVNFFSHKGGKMRKLASKLKEQAEEMEEEMPYSRQEDKTIKPFTIESQDIITPVAEIKSVNVIKDHQSISKNCNITLRKKRHLHIIGPNGIGKSTLLEALAHNKQKNTFIHPDVVVGYYRQDFSGLNMDSTVYESLKEANDSATDKDIYGTAAHFLLPADLLKNKVISLSEGQKGLLCYARFVLQKPGLLILDEPTNHINFRHLPIIAQALDEYEGAMILVSHVPDFVKQIRIDETLDLAKL